METSSPKPLRLLHRQNLSPRTESQTGLFGTRQPPSRP
ncbi:hypothetical protein AZE42_14157 [Rhizopogon vesiculosus]|uniref:Uncharacterized protein n=1 Tax=Rhizopogon vesiculosus TaxID=180088 RepID=A0A1J8Q9W4_9AGAM|nr:hypothetical protein AZE42_14157 [Rhizopogon vesiculosus]